MIRSSANLVGAAALALCALFIVWQVGLPSEANTSPNASTAAPVVGGRVPSFSTYTLQGERLDIHNNLGHPLVINFWATWCAPCESEMPVLERLHQQGVPVLGINAEQGSGADVHAWLGKHNISFPNVRDDQNRTLEALFRVQSGLPITFFVDKDGIIQHIERGALTQDSLRNGLVAMGIE